MDNDLDDFFAKKDKSRKKTKSKFTVDDILQAKKDNEEKSKKGKASKKRSKDPNLAEGVAGHRAEGDEEEWNEVEDETEKDYSGLRIQNLQITAKGDEDRQDNGSQREDGETGESRDSVQGPWKVLAQQTPTVSAATYSGQETPVAEPVKDTPKTPGKYVPPAMRKAQSETPAAAVTSGSSRYGTRGKKAAPNVNSQEDFPTLGSPAEPNEGPAFEKIRGGARQVDDPSSQHIKLSIGNKFDALDADDS